MIEILEKYILPEILKSMERKYKNIPLKNRTVVCGLGSSGNVYKYVDGSCEHDNELSRYT